MRFGWIFKDVGYRSMLMRGEKILAVPRTSRKPAWANCQFNCKVATDQGIAVHNWVSNTHLACFGIISFASAEACWFSSSKDLLLRCTYNYFEAPSSKFRVWFLVFGIFFFAEGIVSFLWGNSLISLDCSCVVFLFLEEYRHNENYRDGAKNIMLNCNFRKKAPQFCTG